MVGVVDLVRFGVFVSYQGNKNPCIDQSEMRHEKSSCLDGSLFGTILQNGITPDGRHV